VRALVASPHKRLSRPNPPIGSAKMLVTVLYLLSAALEIGGIAIVVWDVRIDRHRARALLERPHRSYGVGLRGAGVTRREWMDDAMIRSDPTGPLARHIRQQRREEERRRVERVARASANAETELKQALVDVLLGSKRRLIGPALLVLGVILGTWANLESRSNADPHRPLAARSGLLRPTPARCEQPAAPSYHTRLRGASGCVPISSRAAPAAPPRGAARGGAAPRPSGDVAARRPDSSPASGRAAARRRRTTGAG
jgi:hypothetical protein